MAFPDSKIDEFGTFLEEVARTDKQIAFVIVYILKTREEIFLTFKKIPKNFESMTYMEKDAMKKLKKVKAKPHKAILENSDTEKTSKNEDQEKRFNFGKDLKQKLVAENAYISDILGLVNFPKRADSDDEGKA